MAYSNMGARASIVTMTKDDAAGEHVILFSSASGNATGNCNESYQTLAETLRLDGNWEMAIVDAVLPTPRTTDPDLVSGPAVTAMRELFDNSVLILCEQVTTCNVGQTPTEFLLRVPPYSDYFFSRKGTPYVYRTGATTPTYSEQVNPVWHYNPPQLLWRPVTSSLLSNLHFRVQISTGAPLVPTAEANADTATNYVSFTLMLRKVS